MKMDISRLGLLAFITVGSLTLNSLVVRSQTPTSMPTDAVADAVTISTADDALAPPIYVEVDELPPSMGEAAEEGGEALSANVDAETPATIPDVEAADAGGPYLVQRATALTSTPAASSSDMVMYVVGGIDRTTYYYSEITMPSFMLDADGGRVRMIMQHEIDGHDQVRVIDLFIGTEYTNDAYGRRGRFAGRYGWTRQSGGGDYAWILGDGNAHNIANPWEWAWILDWKWLENGREIGGNKIRLYSHPHVTTRFIFYPN